jgi:ABC-type glutathione transport system ATPase component
MAVFSWTSEDIPYERLENNCSSSSELSLLQGASQHLLLLSSSAPDLGFEMYGNEDEDGVASGQLKLDSYGLPVLPIQKSLGPYVIKLSHISKAYGISGRSEDDSVVALQDVHMDTDSEIYPIRKGEFVMLRGPSGGGKTSLLNILGTIDSPTRGQVEILDNIIDAKARTIVSYHFLLSCDNSFNFCSRTTVSWRDCAWKKSALFFKLSTCYQPCLHTKTWNFQ